MFMQILVARQPIFDRREQLFGYDLVLRRPGASADEPLPELAAWLRTYHVRLLAKHVQHRSERDSCSDLGFELFEGYRFTAPETLTRRDLPIEHVLTFRLLKMVRDPKAADAEIEEVLRR